jgi:hypothetical protein
VIQNTKFGLSSLFLVMVVLTANTIAAADPSFQGLVGIRVKVEVDPALRDDGLSAQQLQSDVENRLQREKITVLSEKQWQTVDHHPLLHIQIHGARVQENWKFYTFGINLYLLQDVTIVREAGTIRHQAATWFTGIAGHGYFGDIQTRVNELVDLFADQFREANPG